MPASSCRYDVVGLGNAIVDVIARADDDFLLAHDLRKGGMTLIDEARAKELYEAMGQTTVVSGGSAANTIIGLAGFGRSAAFIGKVKADELGGLFAHDIRAAKVGFSTPPAGDGAESARCLILVTPDGQRTMNTFLGACQDLTEADVDETVIKDSAVIYLEGYLWDPPAAKDAFRKASKIARAAGRETALSLSDSFCVDRYRDEFLDFIRSGGAQIIFANESELHSLYQTADFDTAVALLKAENILGVVTRSEQGCVVVRGDMVVTAPAFPVDQVVDTTGAGDLFAAGFLAGYTRGRDFDECAKLGALAAAEIIQHIGARPQTDLRQLAEQNGLKV
ncbi:PfkB domain protein [Methylocella silvestris BL2]|uniref:PfkB domain protein n=1 Tax=Methylocella silvestris (strain DSM 15510 / CIP 108128 / LMG 27833 / NCIMB 13906 / BL2) TaxID=395965 RepID=B8ENK3_METSB|nr:adenosine kinase [Methylocella silvestris]ACK50134.1 PfkB domain protein [Methylocella silvestris BL2]